MGARAEPRVPAGARRARRAAAGAIGERDEEERCATFLARLRPAGRARARARAERPSEARPWPTAGERPSSSSAPASPASPARRALRAAPGCASGCSTAAAGSAGRMALRQERLGGGRARRRHRRLVLHRLRPRVRRRSSTGGTPRASPGRGPTRWPCCGRGGAAPAGARARCAGPRPRAAALVEDLAARARRRERTRGRAGGRDARGAPSARGRRRAGRRAWCSRCRSRRRRDCSPMPLAGRLGSRPGLDWCADADGVGPAGTAAAGGPRARRRVRRRVRGRSTGVADDGRRRGDGAARARRSHSTPTLRGSGGSTTPRRGVAGAVLAELGGAAGRAPAPGVPPAAVRRAPDAGRWPRPRAPRTRPVRARRRTCRSASAATVGAEAARRAGLALGRRARRGARRAPAADAPALPCASAALPLVGSRIGRTSRPTLTQETCCMPAIVLVGAQWGDEGKGKATDLLGSRVDYVVKFNGGNNAGHTVVIGDEKYALHLLPSRHPHARRASRSSATASSSTSRCCSRSSTRSSARGVDTSRLLGQRQRARHRAVQPHARQGHRALPRQAPDRHHRPRHRPDVRRQDEPRRHPRAGPVRREDPAPEGRGRPRARRTTCSSRSTTAARSPSTRSSRSCCRTPTGCARWSPTPRCCCNQALDDGKTVLLEGGQATHARRRPRHLPVRHVVERRPPAARAPARASRRPASTGSSRSSRRTRPASARARSRPSCSTTTASGCAQTAPSSAPRPAGRAAAAGTTPSIARYAARDQRRHRLRAHQARRAHRPRDDPGLRRLRRRRRPPRRDADDADRLPPRRCRSTRSFAGWSEDITGARTLRGPAEERAGLRAARSRR